jgi:hypothetical protein
MTSRRAIAALKAACDLDLPAPSLVPVLLEALHDVVPSSRNLFDWTDENGRLLQYFIEGPVDAAVARHYFDVFHNRREREVMPAFDSLLQAPAGVRSASELDHARFFESALYREIWRPQGLKYRLEAVLRGSRGQLIGSLVLYRGPGDRCFSRHDEQQLAALLPLLAGALERSDAPAVPARHVPRPQATQSLLIGPDRRIGHASADARRLLMLASGGITRERLEMPLDRLAAPVLDLLLPAPGARPPSMASAPTPSVTQENAWGCFTFMATWLAPQAGDGSATVRAAGAGVDPLERTAPPGAAARAAPAAADAGTAGGLPRPVPGPVAGLDQRTAGRGPDHGDRPRAQALPHARGPLGAGAALAARRGRAVTPGAVGAGRRS